MDFEITHPWEFEATIDGITVNKDFVETALTLHRTDSTSLVFGGRDAYDMWQLDYNEYIDKIALRNKFNIEKVIFNYPATIVIWEDGTKTVVKVKEDEEFDEWAGLAFCFAKRALGDDFHKVFRKHCDPAVEQKEMALVLFEKIKQLKDCTF